MVETSILAFKAGKMVATLKSNGKYLVEPEGRQGEVHVVWTSLPTTRATATVEESVVSNVGEGEGGHLKIEWRERRTKTTMNATRVYPDDDTSFERVETGRYGDRVYLLRCNGVARSRHFFC